MTLPVPWSLPYRLASGVPGDTGMAAHRYQRSHPVKEVHAPPRANALFASAMQRAGERSAAQVHQPAPRLSAQPVSGARPGRPVRASARGIETDRPHACREAGTPHRRHARGMWPNAGKDAVTGCPQPHAWRDLDRKPIPPPTPNPRMPSRM
jgi:hypothetical protein